MIHHVQLSAPIGSEDSARAFWDAWGMRLERGGLKVTWDDQFPGMHGFYVSDPFGNRLEFLERAGKMTTP